MFRATLRQFEAMPRASLEFITSVADRNTAAALNAGSQLVAPFFEAARPLFAPMDPRLGLVDSFIPEADLLVRWQEFENQLEILLLVPSVESRLGIRAGCEVPLNELVKRAYHLGAFDALWAIEGLGHYFGNETIRQDPDVEGLLTDPDTLDVPASSLTMLNAGIGLSFAEHALLDVNTRTRFSEVVAAVSRFVGLCQQNATPGYEGAALESLGLVVRTFHPQLVATINDVIDGYRPQISDYFWHGVGRAIYFSPRNLVPCSQINWASVADIAPTEQAQRNLIAGLAWAITLVNMRQPTIMAHLLRTQGEFIVQNDAFVNGVKSSIIIRHDITPVTAFLCEYCGYQPDPEDLALVALWDSQIRRPCTNAVERDYPVLVRRHSFSEIFRYHPLSEFPNLAGDADYTVSANARSTSASV